MSPFVTASLLRSDPRRFARRTPFATAIAVPVPATTLSDEMRLFAATFAAGFIVVSALIA